MNWYKKAQEGSSKIQQMKTAKVNVDEVERKLRPYLIQCQQTKPERSWLGKVDDPKVIRHRQAVNELSKIVAPAVKDLKQKKDIESLEALAGLFKKYDSIEAFYCYLAIEQIKTGKS